MTRVARRTRPQFGNWIRARILLTHLAVGAGLAVVGGLLPDPLWRLGAWSARQP